MKKLLFIIVVVALSLPVRAQMMRGTASTFQAFAEDFQLPVIESTITSSSFTAGQQSVIVQSADFQAIVVMCRDGVIQEEIVAGVIQEDLVAGKRGAKSGNVHLWFDRFRSKVGTVFSRR